MKIQRLLSDLQILIKHSLMPFVFLGKLLASLWLLKGLINWYIQKHTYKYLYLYTTREKNWSHIVSPSPLAPPLPPRRPFCLVSSTRTHFVIRSYQENKCRFWQIFETLVKFPTLLLARGLRPVSETGNGHLLLLVRLIRYDTLFIHLYIDYWGLLGL